MELETLPFPFSTRLLIAIQEGGNMFLCSMQRFYLQSSLIGALKQTTGGLLLVVLCSQVVYFLSSASVYFLTIIWKNEKEMDHLHLAETQKRISFPY